MRLLPIIMSGALILSGCFGNKVITTTSAEQSATSFSFPLATIQVSDAFHYEGIMSSGKTRPETTAFVERHIFVDKPSADNVVRRGLVAYVKHLEDPGSSNSAEYNFNSHKGKYLDRGITIFKELHVPFVTQRMIGISDELQAFFFEKGYKFIRSESDYTTKFLIKAGPSALVMLQYFEAKCDPERILQDAKSVVSIEPKSDGVLSKTITTRP